MSEAVTSLLAHASATGPQWHSAAVCTLSSGMHLAALVAGRLGSLPKDATQESKARSSETEQIYELAKNAALLDLYSKPGPQLANLVRTIFQVESVAIFDADLHESYQAGQPFSDLEDLLQNVYLFETVSDDAATGLSRRVLRVGNLPVGALLLRGETTPLVTNAIACLIAITFDRYHALANESRTEAARRTEQLRTTVLDSLAHAYKTPLTAIRAASSGLSEMGNLTPAQAILVEIIEEQSGLLNQLTTRLLKTAQLQTHELTVRPETVSISSVMDDVISSMREQLASVLVHVDIPRENLTVHCDRELLTALLSQYLDNAGKYANEGSKVTIQVAEQSGQIVFSVHSVGPVIPEADFEKVFDRYFRSSIPSNKAPGTGIGLSVAKRAAQAQGGHVWVTSHRDRGTTFFAALPVNANGARS